MFLHKLLSLYHVRDPQNDENVMCKSIRFPAGRKFSTSFWQAYSIQTT